jgi:peroxiredoxin
MSCSNNKGQNKQLKEQNKQLIKGTIKGLGNNIVVLMDTRNYPIDTVQATNGTFEFEHKFDISKPKMQGIFLPQLSNKNGGMRQNKAYFFIDSKDIRMTGEIIDENLKKVEISGSPVTSEYHRFQASFPANIALKNYEKIYNEAFINYNQVEPSKENLETLKHYSSIIDSLSKVKNQNIVDAIPKNSESIALSAIFYYNFNDKDISFLKTNLAKFSPNIRDSYYIAELYKTLNLKESVTIGKQNIDFTLIDHNDKKISLSDFKGKHVLIDFWASWCGPCLKEIPNLKKTYKKFKDKGLEIVSVSIDNKKNTWKKTLEKENLPYTKLWDQEKITQKLYQYNTLPHIVLISPEGKIIKVNDGLRGDQLEKTINSLL